MTKADGISPIAAGAIIATFGLAGAIGKPLVGWLLDIFRGSAKMLSIGRGRRDESRCAESGRTRAAAYWPLCRFAMSISRTRARLPRTRASSIGGRHEKNASSAF